VNNKLLADAAFNGFIAGGLSGMTPPPLAGAPLTALVAAAAIFAGLVDTAINPDATITGAGGAAQIPTTAAICTAQPYKTELMFGLSKSAFDTRFTTDPISGDYAAVVSGVVAEYTAAIAYVLPAGVVNPILAQAAYAGFIVGGLSGSAPPPTTGYANLIAAAKVFSVAIDAGVTGGVDAAITLAGNPNTTQVTNASAAAAAAELADGNLMFGLCRAAFDGRYTTDTTSADYASMVTGVCAEYSTAHTSMPAGNNNQILADAAYDGFVSGAVAGGAPPPSTGCSAALITAATAFATAVDTAIANDANISGGAGASNALAPSTAAIQKAQIGQTDLLFGICEATFEARYTTDPTGADYSGTVAGVKATYTAAVASLP
jgi:hypothetical protein